MGFCSAFFIFNYFLDCIYKLSHLYPFNVTFYTCIFQAASIFLQYNKAMVKDYPVTSYNNRNALKFKHLQINTWKR